ncbi:MAG: hypothetical protein IOC82_02575 [Aestuariivirga sp.]|uniref:hypothetical protein n=1 Tax=Aestuariivirga sp. TaxID=2650926 RepID=UPI0025BBF683|nr:hypothetical protein [Aestuariivirga sp.]MCA3559898.1 hypothetical protein [Aestuariivirga sp.]
MTILNHITLEALPRLPIAEIVALPAGELARLQREADDALRKAKFTVTWLDSALTQKYADRARQARAEGEKDNGTVRFEDDGVTVVADLPKKVEWDQRDLADLVERIKAEGEDPRDYVEVSLKVSERKYGSWPTHIRSLFEPARTVRAGKETFELLVEQEGV